MVLGNVFSDTALLTVQAKTEQSEQKTETAAESVSQLGTTDTPVVSAVKSAEDLSSLNGRHFNGETPDELYRYSIREGDSVSVSDILLSSGCVLDDINAVMSRVDEVVSSDDKILSVVKENGDWYVTAETSFNSEETITIYLNDNNNVVITVTDASVEIVRPLIVQKESGGYATGSVSVRATDGSRFSGSAYLTVDTSYNYDSVDLVESTQVIYADYIPFYLELNEMPGAGVDVNIVFPESIKGDDYRLFYVNGGVTELNGVVDTTDTTGDERAAAIRFHTYFSGDYVLACTKAFNYEIPEGPFVYYVSSDDSFTLQDLLIEAGVVPAEYVELFLQKVTSVSSSNPRTISVELMGETCVLSPLAQIKNETVTVNLDDGQSAVISFSDLRQNIGGESGTDGVLVSSKKNFEISVSYSSEANVPEGSELNLKEIPYYTNDGKALSNQAADALDVDKRDITSVTLVDVSIVKGTYTIEPTVPVDVKVQVDEENTEKFETQVISLGETTDVLNEVESETGAAYEITADSMEPVLAIVTVKLTKELVASDGNTYRVTVEFDKNSGIPGNAELVVSEIGSYDERYDQYVSESLTLLGGNQDDLIFARPFDITLRNPVTLEEYQPGQSVKVSIELIEMQDTQYPEVNVVHFGTEPKVMNSVFNGRTVEFDAEGFSVYVVTGFKVDFQWGDYSWSITGESDILLSELLEKLGVTEISISDVADVRFSDPSLIEIEAKDSDWLLKSLAPFDTQETLSVTLLNGRVVEISVSDERDESKEIPVVTPPTPKTGMVYSGEEQELVSAGTTSGGTMKYSLSEDGTYTEDIPTGEDAGTYTVYYRVDGDDTYSDVGPQSVQASIDPAEVTITGKSGYRDYSGSEQTISGFVCSVEGLSFDGVSASGSGTEIGEYEVTVSGVTLNETRDTTGNYVITKTVDGKLTITELLTKERTGFNGNLASYRITVNPNALTINGNNSLTVKDTFSLNQSIDYSSIHVNPEENASFDYSGYTGVFTIPDGQCTTITYTTRVLGSAGSTPEFDNTALLGVTEGNQFEEWGAASASAAETLTPTGSDISGEGGVYNVKVFVYPDGHLEKGLSGVEFQLLDYNHQPITFKKGDKEGENVIFTTGDDGYTTVRLTEEEHGVSIHKNTVYYLEMVKAPVEVIDNGDGNPTYKYYQKDNTLLSFLIKDNPEYSSGDNSIYTYFNGDVMKVRCYPESVGINVTKRFTGNYTLTTEQKNQIDFVLQKENSATGKWDEVERHSYSEFQYGSLNFNTGKNGWSQADYGAIYRVIEDNQTIDDAFLNTTYIVSSQSNGKIVTEESNEFLVDPDHEAYSFSMTCINEYSNHKLSFYVHDEIHGNLLEGATISTYLASDESTALASYTTDSQGTTFISWDENLYERDTLYYAVQTATCEGYLLPDEPERVYFYFSENSDLVPVGVPSGEITVDLSKTFYTISLANSCANVNLPVVVTWGLNGAGTWPENVDHVLVKLYRSVNGADFEPVPNYDQVTLDSSNRFDNSAFRNLPIRDSEGHKIEYTFKETIVDAEEHDITQEYAVSCTISGTGWYVIRNQGAVSIRVKKEWFDLEGNPVTDTSGKPAVYFDLYRTTAEIASTEQVITRETLINHLSSAKPIQTGLMLYADNGWEMEISSLQEKDSTGADYYYFVVERDDHEHMPENHADSYEISPVSDTDLRTLTIRNTKTPVTIYIQPNDNTKCYGDEEPDYDFNIVVQQIGATATCELYDSDIHQYKVTVTAPNQSKTDIFFKLTRDSGENVGSYTLTPFGEDSQEGYRVRYETGTLTIGMAEVSVIAGAEKTYGSLDPSLVSVEGLKNGDDPSIIHYDFYRIPGEDVGTYEIYVSGDKIQGNGNYQVNYSNGLLNITRIPAVVTANYKQKVYGDEDPELTVTISGLKEGDSESVIEYSLARMPGEDCGDYDISVSGDEIQGNYSVTYEPGMFVITHAPLTVQVNDAEKIYGDADPDWTTFIDIDGLKGSDRINDPIVEGNTYTYVLRDGKYLIFNLNRDDQNGVGQYTVTPSGLSEQSNYEVTFKSGKLTIFPAQLTITPVDTIKDVNQEEDPILAAEVTGWKYDDGEAELTAEKIEGKTRCTYTLNGSQILVFTLHREPSDETPGDKTIYSRGDTSQGNYEITYETGIFSILEVFDIEISQLISDPVDSDANPEISYVATVDLDGTGLTELTGFDENNQREFTLGGTNPSSITLKIPDGAGLSVQQITQSDDYKTTLKLDDEDYPDDEGQRKIIIDKVDNYFLMTFTQNRICLPVQAMAGIGQTDVGAEPVTPRGFMPIPESDQLINNDFVQTLESSIGYIMPADKYFVYNHAVLFNESDGSPVAENISYVKYDKGNATWRYKVEDGTAYETIPSDCVLRLYYWPKHICKIGQEKFYTLNAALSYMQDNGMTHATIEMLLDDFVMPLTDSLTIPEGYSIILTTAEEEYEGEPGTKAKISRSVLLKGNMFVNNGELILENIDLDGNAGKVSGAEAMILNGSGNLIVQNNVSLTNTNGINGGALYVAGGEATIYGDLRGNEASNGGAVYISGGILNLSSEPTEEETYSGTICNNSASKGGAVFMIGGTLNIHAGGTVSENTSENGGAFYLEGGTLNITDGASVTGNTAGSNGGMLYGNGGEIIVTGGAVDGNTASIGNGGAICYEGSGTVKVSGGTFSNNTAALGNGGAIYQSSGTVTLTVTRSEKNEVIAQSIISGNSARNGAAIYVASGITNFSGCSITGNTPSEGGAVGMDINARMYFSGNTVIKDNKVSNKQRNIYLNQDSDEIINVPAEGLGSAADIRVYVTDSVRAQRWEMCTSFGSYVGTGNLGKFKDDRGKYDVYSSENKLYWGKPIKFTVRYLSSGFPTNTNLGSQLYPKSGSTTYYPKSTTIPIYDLVTALYNEYYHDNVTNKIYSYSFVKNEVEFDKYITGIEWNSNTSKWEFSQNDGSTNDSQTEIIIFYSDAAFISITNNTSFELTIDPLSVMEKMAVDEGYGYTVVIDNVTQTTLLSITQDHLTIPADGSVRFLFPGAIDNNWTMQGVFERASQSDVIKYTLDKPHGGIEQNLETTEVQEGVSFRLNGKTRPEAGGVYEILFGAAKPICKVEDSEGEHPFGSLNEAWTFITNGSKSSHEEGEEWYQPSDGDTKTATIEMLLDYQQPSNDILEIEEGYNITLTTAASSGKRYNYSGLDDTCATISRSSGDIGSAVKALINDGTAVLSDDATTSLTVSYLIFDGKALGQGGQGGAINTSNVKVTIDHCEFKGYTAERGGAIYTKWGTLEVGYSNFENCRVYAEKDKTGGGGIWTTAHSMTVDYCTFKDCYGQKQAQGSAVFHNIRYDDAVVHPDDSQKFPKGFSKDSNTTISYCTFENCTANGSGGTVESDAWFVTFDHCNFTGSQTLKSGGNGGAINIYTNDNKSIPSTGQVEVRYCTFTNCSAPNGNTNGGAIRTLSPILIVEDSSFTNVHSNKTGGAISMTNAGSQIDIRRCTFDTCSAGTDSGAINAYALRLNVEDSSFVNCTAPSYGCINQSRDNAGTYVKVYGSSFENCTSTNSQGGALFVKAKALTITGKKKDFTFKTCTSSTDGGAVYHVSGTTDTLSECVFDSCSAGNNGGAAVLPATTVTVNDSFVSNCKAVNNGGGLYVSPGTSATLKNCNFSNNWVTNSESKGGSLFINQNTVTINGGMIENSKAAYGGGIYQKGTLNLNGSTIDSCYAVERGGGLYHEGTVSSSGIIKNSFAKQGGGIYSSGKLEFTGNNPMVISGCKAKNVTLNNETGVATPAAGFASENQGGGVYNSAGEFTMNNAEAVIGGCEAYDGAGIYQAGGTFTLSGGVIGSYSVNNSEITYNTAENFGGGVYFADGSFNMSVPGGRIGGYIDNGNTHSGNVARKGAGVFVADGKTLKMSGGRIEYNNAVSEGGGIAVGGASSKLLFEQLVYVQNNTQGDDIASNVYLDQDVNSIIQTSNIALNASSYIGVYASDEQYDSHGIPGMPFGTFGSSSYLNRFQNDRINFLYGTMGEGNKIVWSKFVCKITDGEGNLLYKDGHQKEPAVYSSLENGLSESAFNVLAKDNPSLYKSDGTSYSGEAYQVQMLVQEYKTGSPISLNKSRTITLTTASSEPDECGFKYTGDPKHPYATIIRNANYESMFSCSGNSLFTLSGIVLDGGSESGFGSSKNGGLLLVSGGSQVTVGDKATLQNSTFTNPYSENIAGAAIRMQDANSKLYLEDGGLITNCVGAVWGGAVSVKAGEFIMNGGTITQCEAQNGGAVRIDSKMYMNGGSISGNNASISGGGISAGNVSGGVSAKIYFSGNSVVKDNTLNNTTPCNVQLNPTDDKYYNDFINTTGDGLGLDAYIGVYADGSEEATNSQYNMHGKENTPFGTWISDQYLYNFVNDRNGLCGGKVSDSDKKVYWLGRPLIVVQKKVSSDWAADKTLEYTFNVQLTLESPLPILISYGFTSDGFATLTLKDGEEKTLVLPISLLGTPYRVSEIVDGEDFTTSIVKNDGDEFVDTEVSGTLGENISGEEGSTSASVLGFTNTRVKNDFSISKRVESKDESDFTKIFSYTLSLEDETINKSYEYTLLNKDQEEVHGALTFTNGVTDFELRHGEIITIKDLPTDLPYKLEENLDPTDSKFFHVRYSKGSAPDLPYNSEKGVTGTVGEDIGKEIGEVTNSSAPSVTFLNNKLETVCKITDRDRNLLYYLDGGEPVPAVYFHLEDAFDQVNRGGLKKENGGSYTGTFRIEMLVPEYDMDRSAEQNANKTVILSTAHIDDEDGFPYRADEDGTAIVNRGYNGDSMIINAGTLTLENITLDGGSTASNPYSCTGNGGIIKMSGNNRLTIKEEATLRNSNVGEKNGGAVYLCAGSQVTEFSGIISNCSASNGGGIYAENGITKMSVSGIIESCKADEAGGAIYTGGETGNITLNGATIEKNNAKVGGGLYVTFSTTITNTSFENNSASKEGKENTCGGAIYATSTANITISGASTSFVNNRANHGGVIYNDGNVTMIAGVMRDNIAYRSGGAIFVGENHSFTMNGGTITENRSPRGAIYTENNANLYFSGNVKITDNKADFSHDESILMNVYLGFDNNTIINTTGLSSKAEIGVYVADGENQMVYYKHGIAGRNFATYNGNSPTSAGLNHFINDRDSALTAVDGELQDPNEPGVYYVMWRGKSLNLNIRKFDVLKDANGNPIPKVDESGNPIRKKDEDGNDIQLLDEDGHPKVDKEGHPVYSIDYQTVTEPDPVAGAKFTLTNITHREETGEEVVVWEGTSDSTGLVTVPWGKSETDHGNTAVFASDSIYELKQVSTADGCVMPGGSWKLTVDYRNAVTWELILPEEKLVNRTINIVDSEAEEGKLPVLGDSFTLYNDRTPTISFDVNGDGAKFADGSVTRKTEEISFQDQNPVVYTIKEANPVWNTKFLNWNTDSDGEGDTYIKEDTIKFWRQSDCDDVILYAQWIPIVCKITDFNNNLLYINGEPAIYSSLKAAFDDFSNPELRFTRDSASKTRSYQSYIKMLVQDYELTEPLTLGRNRPAILTTASPNDTDGYPAQSNVTICTIKRDFDDNERMITNEYFLTLREITLDGNKSKYPNVTKDGSIVSVGQDGKYATLSIASNATLINGATSGNGGAVYAEANTEVLVTGDATIRSNEAKNGGAIYAAAGAELVMDGGEINLNRCSDSGAGIYLSYDSRTNTYGTLQLSGTPYFGGVSSVENGKITTTTGNFKEVLQNNKTNGGDVYEYARQDIFISGFSGEDSDVSASSLIITGEISGGEGTIWVWAEQAPHYKALEQFAKIAEGVTVSEKTCNVFRNAQDDATSQNETDSYLLGTLTGEIAGNIYWNGNYGRFPVILRKVLKKGEESYQSLAEKKFTVYKTKDEHTPAVKDLNGKELSGLVSEENGVFYVGILPKGKYYVKEESPSKWFCITVNENGVGYEEDDKTIEPYVDPMP